MTSIRSPSPQRLPEKGTKRRPPRTVPKKWQQQLAGHPHISFHTSTSSEGKGGGVVCKGGGSVASSLGGFSTSTPSSVHVSGQFLSRDLSDLSGSYKNGMAVSPRTATTTPSSSSKQYGNEYMSDQSATSYNRPWAQAHILSSREPQHPQPHRDCDDDDRRRKRTLCLQDSNGIIEVVKSSDEETSSSSHEEHVCIPLLILLMDPGRKMFEIMQIWIDIEEDTVRDTLYTVCKYLSTRLDWKQDYDGLFQVRNNNFSQLIHILNVSKYDIRPYELCIAKPWSMSAKAAISYATQLLSYLKGVGIMRYVSSHEVRSNGLLPKLDDSILVLTQEAKSRIYITSGIQKHHHAIQFLSFSPTFEPMMRVDVLSNVETDDAASQLSDSQCGISYETRGASRGGYTNILEELNLVPKNNLMARDTSFEATWSGGSMMFSQYEPAERGVEVGLSKNHSDTVGTKSDARWRRMLLMLSLSSLCEKRKAESEKQGNSSTLEPIIARTDALYNSSDRLSRVEEDSSHCEKSIVSDSAPLLLFDRESGKAKLQRKLF